VFYDITAQLNQIIFAATERQLGKPFPNQQAIAVSPTKDPEFGDFTTNVAMVLAKPLKKAPRDIAEDYIAVLKNSWAVAKAEAAGPGFINITLKDDVLLQNLKEIFKDKDRFGCSERYLGKQALIEFVSANPTGPLHVGHVRGAIVGDTTASVLKAVGYSVEREYYYNDAGVQMQMLGRSVQARYRELCGADFEFPENGYKGEYIRGIATDLKNRKGESLLEETGWEPFTEFAADILMKIIMDDLKKLRVHFDNTFSERSLHTSGKVQETLAQLAERGATYKEDNAIWLKTTDHGDEKDRVLVKSDGEVTYVTPDIAYHVNKYERGYDLLVNIMGHDHHSQVERVRIALELFGLDLGKLKYLLNQMVSIQRGGEKIKLSTREGQFMTMAEMVDELGSDVTRYFYAQRGYNAQMVFDWDLAKEQSMENPVYYLQYVHARCCSMESKAQERGYQVSDDLNIDTSALLGKRERLVLLKLFQYPMAVMEAAERLESQLIPAYLEELAKNFHGYYQVQRVLDDEDETGSLARYHLVLAVRQVMRNGLNLLNVEAPNRM